MAKYDLTKSESKTLALVKEMMAHKPETQPRNCPTQGYGGFGRNANLSMCFCTDCNPSLPFPSGSTRSPSSACCILCAERGHTVFSHEQDNSPVKFNDGKLAWAKFTNKSLCSPDNSDICISWNIRGDHANCNHPKNKHLHICSFCGKTHLALSWTCHSWPTDA